MPADKYRHRWRAWPGGRHGLPAACRSSHSLRPGRCAGFRNGVRSCDVERCRQYHRHRIRRSGRPSEKALTKANRLDQTVLVRDLPERPRPQRPPIQAWNSESHRCGEAEPAASALQHLARHPPNLAEAGLRAVSVSGSRHHVPPPTDLAARLPNTTASRRGRCTIHHENPSLPGAT